MKGLKYMEFLALLLVCLMVACSQEESKSEMYKLTLEVSSSVSEMDCYICGFSLDTPMSNYVKTDSIGIIYWNEPVIADTKVRVYESDGTEQFHTGVMMVGGITSGGKHGSAVVHAFPDNGISEISIRYQESDKINIATVSKILCQVHLNQVVDHYMDYSNHEKENIIGTTGFSLVDFQTKKIYPLSGPSVGYKIRDYFVRYFSSEVSDEANDVVGAGMLDVLIFYSPVRKPNWI